MRRLEAVPPQPPSSFSAMLNPHFPLWGAIGPARSIARPSDEWYLTPAVSWITDGTAYMA